MNSIKRLMSRTAQVLLLAASAAVQPLLLASCSEEEEASATDLEFADWQSQNEQFFATLEDSLQSDPALWRKMQNLSSESSTDYVYAKDLGRLMQYATSDDAAKFTDSIEVSYEGRLIVSKTAKLYPEGMVFDSTVFGKYDDRTNATSKMLVSDLTDGFATAIQYMRRGDHWRIYVPYTLGYGTVQSGSIPPYSTLIFEVTLKTISHTGEALPPLS